MLGETTLGTYAMYAALILLALVMLFLFLRVAVWLSLLFISPIADVLRRIPVVRGWIPGDETGPSNER